MPPTPPPTLPDVNIFIFEPLTHPSTNRNMKPYLPQKSVMTRHASCDEEKYMKWPYSNSSAEEVNAHVQKANEEWPLGNDCKEA